MCGIVGYVGKELCLDKLVGGLERLEYRGYDSAGVAIYDDQEHCINIRKNKGRLQNLKDQLNQSPINGRTGIGHTRWATHGEPNDQNSHPHTNVHQNIAIVHNGIIENYDGLKRALQAKGISFSTDTDTEVIAQLLGYYYDGNMHNTLLRVLPMLEGSFALGILDANEPDHLFCVRKDSPLVIGVTDSGYLVASDIPAILNYSRDVYGMDDGEIAVVSQRDIHFFDMLGNEKTKDMQHIDWDIEAAEKAGYEHFMLKEIHEQPKVLADTLAHYVDTETWQFRKNALPLIDDISQMIGRITIIACGTAYHAGLVGKALIEKAARIPVNVEIASEYRYRDAIHFDDELFIVISQSGETADTIAAMRLAKQKEGRVLALCNVIGSTIAREADAVMYTMAGPEIAVASTKAYSSQVLLLELISLFLSAARGNADEVECKKRLQALAKLPDQVQKLLDDKEKIQLFANRHFDSKSVFFLGRLLDFISAQEAALKLKEISYIHSEPYAAGELKHGTIALIEEGTLVVALATQRNVIEKMRSNIEEVRVRGADILVLTMEGDGRKEALEGLGEVWTIPNTYEEYAPILTIMPMQLFSYFMALEKGCDIDKPRNLAKSVTVE